MTKIQEKLLNILRAFDTICRKYDIEYFLTGGSALGAIRHNGFIPWDDDIDVGMRRTMWEKLRPILKEELPDNLVMVDYIDYPTYRNPIAKIIDKESTVLYRASLADGCPKGQYLEIFMHDPVPESRLAEHKRDFLMYCELMTPYFSVFHEKLSYKKGLLDEELAIMNEYSEVSRNLSDEAKEALMAELLKKISQYPEEGSDYLLLEWGVNTCYYPLENFSGVRYERLGDLDVPVASRACDNLRIDYGNSWTDYPPAQYRVAHVTVGDENICGDVFMDIIRKQIAPEKTRAVRLSQKDVNIRAIPERVAFEKKILELQMKQAIAAGRRVNLRVLNEGGNFKAIAEAYRNYIAVRKKLRNYDFSLDIDQESKEIIAGALVMLGRLSDAENVLGLPRNMFIRQAGNPVAADILKLTKAGACYYDGLFDEAHRLLNETDERFRESLTAQKTSMRLDVAEGEIPAAIDSLMEEYPGDIELVKIKGDSLLMQGKKDEADTFYDRVLRESSNGMDIIDINKKRAYNA